MSHPLRAFQDALLVQRVASRFAAVEGKMVGKDPKGVGDWLSDNVLKSGQKVLVWTGRGKQDFHSGTVSGVKLWPKPGDKAFDRENLTGHVNRKDEYTIKFEGEPAYPGEPRERNLLVEGTRSGDGMNVSFGKSKVFKLSLL